MTESRTENKEKRIKNTIIKKKCNVICRKYFLKNKHKIQLNIVKTKKMNRYIQFDLYKRI